MTAATSADSGRCGLLRPYTDGVGGVEPLDFALDCLVWPLAEVSLEELVLERPAAWTEERDRSYLAEGTFIDVQIRTSTARQRWATAAARLQRLRRFVGRGSWWWFIRSRFILWLGH